jgi:hypothetical protein
MPKVDEVQPDIDGGFGFIVRKDNNNLAAYFSFKTESDARTAQQKMKEILAKCENVAGYP